MCGWAVDAQKNSYDKLKAQLTKLVTVCYRGPCRRLGITIEARLQNYFVRDSILNFIFWPSAQSLENCFNIGLRRFFRHFCSVSFAEKFHDRVYTPPQLLLMFARQKHFFSLQRIRTVATRSQDFSNIKKIFNEPFSRQLPLQDGRVSSTGLFMNPNFTSPDQLFSLAEVNVSSTVLTNLQSTRSRCDDLVRSLAQSNPIVVLDEMSNNLCKLLDAAECIRLVGQLPVFGSLSSCVAASRSGIPAGSGGLL